MNRLQDVNRNKQKVSEWKWEAGQLSDAADYAMRRGMPNMRCGINEVLRRLPE